MIDIKKIDTEKHNVNSEDIDMCDVSEIVRRINEEDKKVAMHISEKKEYISRAIDAMLNHMDINSRVIYIGAGTSGRLGVLDASECPPTYGVDYDMFTGIIAGGKDAMFKAQENSEDSLEGAIKDLKDINLKANDVVVGIAASGRTPYVMSALEYANSIGCLTVSISCVEKSKLSEISKYPIDIYVGPEIVTGSTRMKAGTCQKMILNMISTTIMIKKGKVFSGYMIDVKPQNAKLIQRAIRIISTVTGEDLKKSEKYLMLSDKNVKVAILMILLKNENKQEVLNYLKENDENVSKVIRKIRG